MHQLLDRLGSGIAPGDFDAHGIVQQPLGKPLDLVRVGGGEHQVLAPPRQQLDDPADVVDEAHVQHPIGLVEDQKLDRG